MANSSRRMRVAKNVLLMIMPAVGNLGVAGSTCAHPVHVSKAVVYRDIPDGVSFRYPASWTRSRRGNSYFGTEIFAIKGVSPVVDVSFNPKGTPFEKTTLLNLRFAYATADARSEDSCGAMLISDKATTALKAVTINGVTLFEVQAGDAGMMKYQSSTLDTVYRQGKCFLFERDAETSGAGVTPGSRSLTEAEQSAIKRRLNTIFMSIRFQA